MTLDEVKKELEKDIQLLNEDEVNALFKKVKSKGLPVVQRMRRTIALESSLIILFTAVATMITMKIIGLGFFSLFFAAFAVLYVAAEIYGFIVVWQTPAADDIKQMLQKQLKKIQVVSSSMITLNSALGVVLAVVILFDANFTAKLPIPAVLLMVAVKVMSWQFALKWFSRKNELQRSVDSMNE